MNRPKTLALHKLHTLFNLRHPKPHSSQFEHKFTTQQSINNPSEPQATDPLHSPQTHIKYHESDNEKLKKSLRKLEAELGKCQKDPVNETETLETFFAEAIGLSETGQNQESEKGSVKLSNLFLNAADRREKSRKGGKEEEELVEFKELSADMIMFAKFLHSKGYLIKANFIQNDRFDGSCFESKYGCEFLKFASEEFAKDHREIYKWLPTGDLKKVAQFGCPSLGRKTVFSAKAMRFGFGIREEIVCNKCTLKESCKFANQSVWNKGAKNVDLTVVMRVITMYALPTRLEVPDEVRNAVNRLLKEVIRLTELEC